MKVIHKILCLVVVATILASVFCFSVSADYNVLGGWGESYSMFPNFTMSSVADMSTSGTYLSASNRVYNKFLDVAGQGVGYSFYPDIPVDNTLGVTTYNRDDVGYYSNAVSTNSIPGTSFSGTDSSVVFASKRISPLTQYRRSSMDANNTLEPTVGQVASRVDNMGEAGHFFDVSINADLLAIRDDYEFTVNVLYPIAMDVGYDTIATLWGQSNLAFPLGYVSFDVSYEFLKVTDTGTSWVSVLDSYTVYSDSFSGSNSSTVRFESSNDPFNIAFGYDVVMVHSNIVNFNQASGILNEADGNKYKIIKNVSMTPYFNVNEHYLSDTDSFTLNGDFDDYISNSISRYDNPANNQVSKGYPISDIIFYTSDTYLMTDRFATNILSDTLKTYNEKVSLDHFSLVEWLGNTLGSVFNVNIFGPISLGAILYLVLGIGFLFVVVKFFAGG